VAAGLLCGDSSGGKDGKKVGSGELVAETVTLKKLVCKVALGCVQAQDFFLNGMSRN
jgi:hypothetical protein